MSSMTGGLPDQESSRFRTVRLSQIRLGLSDPDRRNDVQPQQSNIPFGHLLSADRPDGTASAQ
jgi:hypothetical protein